MGDWARAPWSRRKTKKPCIPRRQVAMVAGRQWLLEGGLDPGINIRGRGLRQVLIEGGLTGLGHQHRETFEGAEGAFLRRRRIVAGAQMGQIVRDQALVVRTEKVQPTELRECVRALGWAVDAAYLSPSP